MTAEQTEQKCLICWRSSAEQVVAHTMTKGGLRLLLCEVCTDRWRSYGLAVTTDTTTPEPLRGSSVSPSQGDGSGVAASAEAARPLGLTLPAV